MMEKRLDPKPWLDANPIGHRAIGPRYETRTSWTNFEPRPEYSQDIEDYI